MDSVAPVDHKVKMKKKGEKIDKYLDLVGGGAEKAVEHEGDGDAICSWSSWNNP